MEQSSGALDEVWQTEGEKRAAEADDFARTPQLI